jgi:prevent-host-death family protein
MLVNVHEAKTHLSKLLRRVEAGEEIVVARGKVPIARIVPIDDDRRMPRQPPSDWVGQVWLAADFDETYDDLIAAFENG